MQEENVAEIVKRICCDTAWKSATTSLQNALVDLDELRYYAKEKDYLTCATVIAKVQDALHLLGSLSTLD